MPILSAWTPASKTTANPSKSATTSSEKHRAKALENLVIYAEESTAVRPLLAKSWDVSPDHLTWTFHLRTDVRFHDGTPFNADAMLFSLGRQFYADHPFHDVEGTYKYWKDMGMDDIVAAMEARDDSTFVIR